MANQHFEYKLKCRDVAAEEAISLIDSHFAMEAYYNGPSTATVQSLENLLTKIKSILRKGQP